MTPIFFGMLGHQSHVYSVHFNFICHYIIFALLLYCITILQVCTVLQQLCPSTQYCIPRSQEIILGKHIPPLKQFPACLHIPRKTILAIVGILLICNFSKSQTELSPTFCSIRGNLEIGIVPLLHLHYLTNALLQILDYCIHAFTTCCQNLGTGIGSITASVHY